MQKKVDDIIQAFEHYRFEDALRQIDQLIKKISKDTKNKNTLSSYGNRTIHIIKCGSLASLGKIHQASQILQTFFSDKILTEMTDRQKFLFCSMAQLAYDDKILSKIEILNKTGKGDVRLQRFMISHRLFSQVSKSFLKQYATEKREEDGLAQIFLEYINELNKIQPVQNYYARNLEIHPDKQVNLKMVELFFMKYFSGINFSKIQNPKLTASIVDLRIRLAINSNKTEDAKKFYLEGLDYIKENFVYLRSIRDVPDNQEQNIRFYIQNCGNIFRQNLQIEKYVPLYDFYNQFLDFALTQKITKDFTFIQSILQKEHELTDEQLYNFKQIPNQKILSHYYSSLQTQLKALTTGQKHSTAKKSDYYKISIKGLMLQILKIHHHVAIKTSSSQQDINKLLSASISFNQILNAYFLQFSKTLTYANQMKNYFFFLRTKFEVIFKQLTIQKESVKLPNNFEKQDDNLILLTNVVKLLVVLNKNKLSNWKETEQWVTVCWSSYQKFIEEVQQSKRRQKGEIFLSDEFITILVDIVIFHIENLSQLDSLHIQSFIESTLVKLMAILDQTTEISPFNGYLKLRLIYVCQKLNYFDKLIDTYLSLDIKSVQFQTLGYFLINPLNSFNLYSQSDNHLTRMVRSYHENHRQTSEYCLKGLKAGTTHQVFEYFSYQKRLQNSFSKMQLFYTLYLSNQRKEHSQFYLNWIEKKLTQLEEKKQKISFNCDTKTMQNLILSLDSEFNATSSISKYNEYYGHLNSPQVFALQINLRKIQALFKSVIQSKSAEQQKSIEVYLDQAQNKYVRLLKTVNIGNLYNITDGFNVTEQYLSKSTSQNTSNQNRQTFTLNKIKIHFLFFLKLTSLKISAFNALRNALTLIRQPQSTQTLINQAKENFTLVFKNIQDSFRELNQTMLWRDQVKNSWLFRQTLFTLNHLFKTVNEEAGKLKKLPKPIKSLISDFSNELQKVVLNNVTTIKFNQNLKLDESLLNLSIDKKYILKIRERDEMLRRTCLMDHKQAKNYLIS